MSKLQEYIKSNPDLVRLASNAAMILVVLISLILIYASATSSHETSYIDPVSGERVYTINTGAISDKEIDIIGFDATKFEDIESDNSFHAYRQLQNYFSQSFPYFKSLSLKKDSIKHNVDDKSYNYILVADDGQKFQAFIQHKDPHGYYLSLKTNNSTILEYNSTVFKQPTRVASTLERDFLPYKYKHNNKTVTVMKDFHPDYETKQYLIKANTCGDEELQNNIRKEVDDWLKSHNYNPDDFDFIMPEYCDKR